jgi:hypothetical protein
MLTEQLALAIATVFTEAAIYINIVAQPASLQLDDRSLLAEWKSAYQRGYVKQASLVVVGGLLGLVAYSSAFGVAARSRRPARELALHNLRDRADQQTPHGYTAGGRYG